MALSTKAELRHSYAARRAALSPALRQRASAAIEARVLHWPLWQAARTILSYVSSAQEVETRRLLAAALAAGKRVAVPVLDTVADEAPRLAWLRAPEDLVPSARRGIDHVPLDGRERADPSAIELAIVPGIAFDRGGGRIGFGGGYFDRLLADLSDSIRLALAFSIQIHPGPLPLDPHDLRVHAIATEEQLIDTVFPEASPS